MNHARTTLRLAATTLAAALATTAVADSRGVSSSESARANGSNAPKLETGIRTGGYLVANHPQVRVHARPSLDSSRRGAGFQTARPSRKQTGANPFDLFEMIERELDFSADDLDSANGPRQSDGGRPFELAEIREWTADDLDSANGPRQSDGGRPFELAEIREWTADDLDSANGPRQSDGGRPFELAEAAQKRLHHDPMDIDWNGTVDMQDFGLLIAAFGSADHDLDGDGVVDGKDLGLMLVRMNSLVATD